MCRYGGVPRTHASGGTPGRDYTSRMTTRRVISGAKASWLAKRWPGAVLVLALLALSVVSATSTLILQRQQAVAARDEVASEAADALRLTMQQTLVGLRGAGAIVGRRGSLDVAAFSSFGRGLGVQPGVSALALEQVVLDVERRSFERRSGLRSSIGNRLAPSSPVLVARPTSR